MLRYELPPPRGPAAAHETIRKARLSERWMARRIIRELCRERECNRLELAKDAILGSAGVKDALAQHLMAVVCTEYADDMLGFDWLEIIALIMAILEMILEWFSNR